MSNYYLSIILPIYNVEKYLERCVNSILAQNFTDYEVIFVDDGSTDGSGHLADSLSKKFKNSKVIHKQNGGLSSARNAGLKETRGKYVFMIDSDDWIEDVAFLKIYENTKDEEPDILKVNYYRRPDNSKVFSCAKPGIYTVNKIKKELLPLAVENTGNYVFSTWSCIYRTDFLKSNNLSFVSERIIGSEDYLFNLQAYIKAEKIVIISDAIYNYDLRDGSLTQRYRKNLIPQYITLHRMMIESVDESGMLTELRESIAYSFVEKMLGVCIKNECIHTSDHTLVQGWMNTRKLVSEKMFLDMVNEYPFTKGRKSRRVLLPLMKMGVVIPTMYLLKK